jgi:extracellular elastinolytic metalloproteinase
MLTSYSPIGLNDPTEGERTIVKDPADLTASKSGWHDERTNTQGNNIDAGSVPEALVYFPTSENLTFEYPYVPDTEDELTYRDAAVTQIFYTTNMYHDLLYILGFTPAAGNFQTNNHGEGGRDRDEVRVLIHHYDGSNNGVRASCCCFNRIRLTRCRYFAKGPMVRWES